MLLAAHGLDLAAHGLDLAAHGLDLADACVLVVLGSGGERPGRPGQRRQHPGRPGQRPRQRWQRPGRPGQRRRARPRTVPCVSHMCSVLSLRRAVRRAGCLRQQGARGAAFGSQAGGGAGREEGAFVRRCAFGLPPPSAAGRLRRGRRLAAFGGGGGGSPPSAARAAFGSQAGGGVGAEEGCLRQPASGGRSLFKKIHEIII
eukprot:SAG31_NODE_352_length_17229_cov_9.658669_14_plen_202_part_00